MNLWRTDNLLFSKTCAVTAQLICAFVFTYAKSSFSHDAADIFTDRYPRSNRADIDQIQTRGVV